MKDINNLLVETARLTGNTAAKRDDVRQQAAAALAATEKALTEALGGSSLRGLKNLSGDDKSGPDTYDAICTQCGAACAVPFRPAANRPVLCSACRGGPRRSPQPFYGARIRANPDAKLVWPTEPDDSTETLCLTPKGNLVMVRCATDRFGDPIDVEVRPVEFDDVLLEDIEGMIRALSVVLPRHIESTKRAGERFASVAHLCDRISDAIGG